ncbi:uncharacterized protein K444DRAFT_630323 [Hyaloscypha bicolor E]|uniref:Uncharacterized protein n=1 Tax=Hyaloscypha bicolor E TaxID=1095630 RepID=A0A2J6T6H6_9HELO|nr:uncharacterized protein K444DRAFT_630323 [Hyaloscypha bicolor E]PMD58609.1 hypothetical protein K444DRAFT_630323 [Hyaloscypha bicolor E]
MSYSLEMEFDDSLEIELDDQPMPSPPSTRSRRGLDNTTERRQEWIFSCGHKLISALIIPNSENTVVIPMRGRNAAAILEKHSPDKCPECAATGREAEKNKNKTRQDCEETVAALKAHAEFLKTQVANAQNNLQLKVVFGKLLRDCKKELSGKLIELTAEYRSLKGKQVSHSESFQTRLNETEGMVDLIVAVAASKAGPGVEISRALLQSPSIQAEYKQLRKKYEKSTKRGFEEAATRLEGVRDLAMNVIMGIK